MGKFVMLKKILFYVILQALVVSLFSQHENIWDSLLCDRYSVDIDNYAIPQKVYLTNFFDESIFKDRVWKTTNSDVYSFYGIENTQSKGSVLHVYCSNKKDDYADNYFSFNWAQWSGDGVAIFDKVTGKHQQYTGNFLDLTGNNSLKFEYIFTSPSLNNSVRLRVDLVDVHGHQADATQFIALEKTAFFFPVSFFFPLENMRDISSEKWWNIRTGRDGKSSDLEIQTNTDTSLLFLSPVHSVPVDFKRIVEIRFRILAQNEIEGQLVLGNFSLGVKTGINYKTVKDFLEERTVVPNDSADAIFEKNSMIGVSPNPACNYVNTDSHVVIYNNLGSVVAQGSGTLDVSFLKQGIYVVNKRSKYSSLIIQR